MKDYTEKYQAIIVPIAEKDLPHAHIIFYGSRARKDFHEGSDIDISLDAGSKIDDLVMRKIIGDLEESNLPIAFDVIDFCATSEDMKRKIRKEGVMEKISDLLHKNSVSI